MTAEQHLLHFGRSDAPVCWTICGLTSQTRTAEQLRIGSATLYRKLKSYGLIGRARSARKTATAKR